MKRYIILLVITVVAACAFPKMPMNTDEWKTAVQTKGGDVIHVTVNAPFSTVVKRINSKAPKCFNYTVSTSRTNAYGVSGGGMTLDYNATLTKESSSLASFVIQEVPRGPRSGPEMPKGGFYRFYVEIKKVSRSTTDLDFYSFGWNKTVGAISNWANGKSTSCPN